METPLSRVNFSKSRPNHNIWGCSEKNIGETLSDHLNIWGWFLIIKEKMMATWEECNQAIEKIVPPQGSYIDLAQYEEKEVTIGGETLTILVKKSDESE